MFHPSPYFHSILPSYFFPFHYTRRWAFAQENKIILTDEYDQISRDLDPFRALEPQDLRHRNRVMQEREHTSTLSIKNGHVTRHGQHSDLRRAKDMQNLLQKFAKFIPSNEVNLTFIIDDQPAVMLPWVQKERMLELAKQGECEWAYFTSRTLLVQCGVNFRSQANKLSLSYPILSPSCLGLL